MRIRGLGASRVGLSQGENVVPDPAAPGTGLLPGGVPAPLPLCHGQRVGAVSQDPDVVGTALPGGELQACVGARAGIVVAQGVGPPFILVMHILVAEYFSVRTEYGCYARVLQRAFARGAAFDKLDGGSIGWPKIGVGTFSSFLPVLAL